MNKTIHDTIVAVFNEVFMSNNIDVPVPELTNESILLASGLDSLGFAILVIRLETELGFDPFVLSTEAYYPQTFGEFVSFYELHAPK